ncbi:MAG TPA: hypothetical protein DCX34_03500 [Roseovarius sp.]|nr:hypothetical protein [Roseovarius sp.]
MSQHCLGRCKTARAETPPHVAAVPPLRACDIVPMVPPLPGDHRRAQPQSSSDLLPDDGCGLLQGALRDAILFAGIAAVTITMVLASAGLGMLLGQAGSIGGAR